MSTIPTSLLPIKYFNTVIVPWRILCFCNIYNHMFLSCGFWKLYQCYHCAGTIHPSLDFRVECCFLFSFNSQFPGSRLRLLYHIQTLVIFLKMYVTDIIFHWKISIKIHQILSHWIRFVSIENTLRIIAPSVSALCVEFFLVEWKINWRCSTMFPRSGVRMFLGYKRSYLKLIWRYIKTFISLSLRRGH